MCGLQGNSQEDLNKEVMRRAACGDVCPAPPPAPSPHTRSENKELLRQQLLSASKDRHADKTEPTKHKHSRNRQKNRWKLKFHHQALPQEYLDHYERSLQRAAPRPSPGTPSPRAPSSSTPSPAPTPAATPSPAASPGSEPAASDEAFRVWAQRLAALRPAAPAPDERRGRSPAIAPSKIVSYEDLPYMGEMTLNNSKPRRGRKPKKADICHLIYENYGTVVPGQPPRAAPPRRSPLHHRIISNLLERRRTAHTDPQPDEPQAERVEEPLNLCVRDLTGLRLQPAAHTDQPNAISVIQRRASPPRWGGVLVAPLVCCAPPARLVLKRISDLLEPPPEPPQPPRESPPRPSPPPAAPAPTPSSSGVKRKRSAIFIPPAAARGSAPRAEVSICKFKFTGGSKPSLQEKKMLSVDAGGNFRYYSGAGVKGGAPRGGAAAPREGGAPAAAPPAATDETRKRKSRKSLQREKLERTFKEKGFLIQTQQLQSAEGATYCKFRQLRKFTRYLFRSWKDYLPGELQPAGAEPQPPASPPWDAAP